MRSLIFYITIFIIVTILTYKIEKEYKKENKRKVLIIFFIVLIIAILTIIASIRYDVGTDFFNYIGTYEKYKTVEITKIFKLDIEITFALIAKIAYLIGNETIMFAIYSIITVGFIIASILKRKDKISISLSMFLYLFLFFLNSFNGMRQYAAISIIAFSYTFISERKFLKFLICVIVASLFHNTAILFLPFYFLAQEPKENLSKKKRLLFLFLKIVIVCAILGIMLNINKFISIFAGLGIESFNRFYAYTNIERSGRNLMILVNLAVLMFVLIYRKKIVKYDKENNILFFFLVIDVVLTLSGFIAPVLKRIALYFEISQIYLLPSIPKVVQNKKEKQFLTLGIMIYAVAIFIISVYILGQSDLIPYKTIFGGI